jgi:hypothetical protein
MSWLTRRDAGQDGEAATPSRIGRGLCFACSSVIPKHGRSVKEGGSGLPNMDAPNKQARVPKPRIFPCLTAPSTMKLAPGLLSTVCRRLSSGWNSPRENTKNTKEAKKKGSSLRLPSADFCCEPAISAVFRGHRKAIPSHFARLPLSNRTRTHAVRRRATRHGCIHNGSGEH